MSRPRALISHPFLTPSGGGNAVAAWTLQALREQFDLTLATLGDVDHEALNRNFGASLRASDFAIRIAPARWRAAVRYSPTRGALFQACVMMRWAQQLDRAGRFDLLFSTQNEADFGRAGVQYVHYPWLYLPRPDVEMQWFHRIPGFLAAYRGICTRVANATNEGLRRNFMLANSRFVAERIRKVHGVESQVVYPPVPGGFPDISWEQRKAGVVALGRMVHLKRWEMAVEIVERARAAGAGLTLTLISHREESASARRIGALAAARPWFRILYDLTRAELVREVAAHRFGIHTMEDEHFGIAPAELQRAGCVTLVHRSGGPVEIVGGREELMFADAAEGSQRLARAALDPTLQDDLRRYVEGRRDCFSEERFCREVRSVAASRCGVF